MTNLILKTEVKYITGLENQEQVIVAGKDEVSLNKLVINRKTYYYGSLNQQTDSFLLTTANSINAFKKQTAPPDVTNPTLPYLYAGFKSQVSAAAYLQSLNLVDKIGLDLRLFPYKKGDKFDLRVVLNRSQLDINIKDYGRKDHSQFFRKTKKINPLWEKEFLLKTKEPVTIFTCTVLDSCYKHIICGWLTQDQILNIQSNQISLSDLESMRTFPKYLLDALI